MYEVCSQNGWRTCAFSLEEARQLADMRHKLWWDMGVDLEVEVYYKGERVYIAKGPHKDAT